MPQKQDALKLLNEWVSSDSLKKHCLAVAYAMEFYAKKYGEDKDLWWMCGLLHDMDYEKFPDVNIHPAEGCKELRKQGYDEKIVEAILAHNEKTGIKRNSKMAKCLFAVDELCGLIVALAKVRPDNFKTMTQESVKKALKKKDFAKNINREDIIKGIAELEVNENEHFDLVIGSLQGISSQLGFNNDNKN
ncbi:HDIG domain-containing protein [Candidatus Pacearchaeota archaeon]|nr:HDIG domain-containing protein [Candidatus Pacearchaeota archaeon]